MNGTTNTTYLAALAGLIQHIKSSLALDDIVPAQWREELPGYESLVEQSARLAIGRADKTGSTSTKVLRSIFCDVTADGEHAPKEAYYWPLAPLALENKNNLFPKPEAAMGDVETAYQALCDQFTAEARALCDAHARQGNLPVYLESLLLLLQRYTWCLPGSYADVLPDVSLYDHARMAAALAACRSEAAGGQDVALLVGGDISGVQDFIYTITARGATSALRGRSFYLQLLTEAVARYILRRLDLPATNLIYQGGGGFYLLARPGDTAALQEIQQEISRVLLTHHRGELYVAVAHEPLRQTDFFGGAIAQKWNALSQTLRRVKQRQFAELAAPDLEILFDPQGIGGDESKQCLVCGREHPGTQVWDTDVPDAPRKCPPCHDYEEWGKKLRDADYVWLDYIPLPVAGIATPSNAGTGNTTEVLAAFGLRAGTDQPNHTPQGMRVMLALKDVALVDLNYDANTIIGRRFLVNVTPVITQAEIDALRDKIVDLPARNSVKPFDVLAAQSKGIERLGVLRMDVDNLGKLFAEGLSDKASLARTAGLSFAVSLYFEGWVGALAQQINAAQQDKLYAIYSGGDDLFFVGAWDVLLDLASRIRADLQPFTAYHPGLHVSGGLVLIGGKYPLAQAAKEAGEAEHQAKSVSGKNAMSFLALPLSWPSFEKTRQLATDLAGWIEKEQVSRALLQHLHVLYMEWLEKHHEDNPYGPWIWHSVYQLQRALSRNTQPEIGKVIENWPQQMIDDPRFIERLGLASRWAALLTRQ